MSPYPPKKHAEVLVAYHGSAEAAIERLNADYHTSNCDLTGAELRQRGDWIQELREMRKQEPGE